MLLIKWIKIFVYKLLMKLFSNAPVKEQETQSENHHENFIDIGNFTYGNPSIAYWDDKTSLKIGKLCSIADGVTIMLGGEHRVD